VGGCNDTQWEDGVIGIVVDNAEVSSFVANHRLDGFADNGKREYYKMTLTGFDPHDPGLQLTIRNRRWQRRDRRRGRGDDWACGRLQNDDTICLCGGQALALIVLVKRFPSRTSATHKHSDQGTTALTTLIELTPVMRLISVTLSARRSRPARTAPPDS